MIALYDFTPKFCAGCGHELPDLAADQDFTVAHCSYTCSGCSCQYQRTTTAELLQAATASGGDMAEQEGGEVKKMLCLAIPVPFLRDLPLTFAPLHAIMSTIVTRGIAMVRGYLDGETRTISRTGAFYRTL